MNHDILAQRKCAGIGDHRPEKFNAFFIGWNYVAGSDAIVARKDRVHAAVLRIALAVRSVTELVVPGPIGQALANV